MARFTGTQVLNTLKAMQPERPPLFVTSLPLASADSPARVARVVNTERQSPRPKGVSSETQIEHAADQPRGRD